MNTEHWIDRHPSKIKKYSTSLVLIKIAFLCLNFQPYFEIRFLDAIPDCIAVFLLYLIQVTTIDMSIKANIHWSKRTRLDLPWIVEDAMQASLVRRKVLKQGISPRTAYNGYLALIWHHKDTLNGILTHKGTLYGIITDKGTLYGTQTGRAWICIGPISKQCK